MQTANQDVDLGRESLPDIAEKNPARGNPLGLSLRKYEVKRWIYGARRLLRGEITLSKIPDGLQGSGDCSALLPTSW